MDRQQLSQLFERYLRNQCTEAEIATLLHHFGEQEDSIVLKELVIEALRTEVDEHFAQQEDVAEAMKQADAYLVNFLAKDSPSKRGFIRYLRYSVAAAVVLASSIGFYFYQHSTTLSINEGIQLVDADPGTDKAILTLANGRKIILDGNEDEAILEDEGIAITKTADGRLIYSSVSTASSTNSYNEITTPRGGQYQIILPDGSNVWLNAASTLKYPIQFREDKRVVELEGEAYFEVRSMKYEGRNKKVEVRGDARDASVPFIVKTQGQEIEVLGTQFNVSAYANEYTTKTTLVEGSVRVALTTDYQSPTTLKPGQQAASANGNMHVYEVDVENEISWKNGDFAFSNMPLMDIMRHLSRWYDVEIDGMQMPQTRYTIFVSRKVKLSSVLRMLEKAGNLRFALDTTNQIIITPKTEKPM